MLTLADREEISRCLAAHMQQKDIAAAIGRNPSVVSREIARHGGRRAYRAHRADTSARKYRRRPKCRKIDADPQLKEHVVGDLRRARSPQQISGRLCYGRNRGETDMSVSHEAIYTWLYALPKGELAAMDIALRSGRTRRQPPDGRDAEAVREGVIESVRDMPANLRRSITWDQGTEMAEHAALTLATDIPVYFAHAHSPWERGTNENTNRIVREYFPKGTDITGDIRYLQAVADEINDRPRAILGFRTPAEVFAELLLADNPGDNLSPIASIG